jgi:hypothetical protein
MSSLSNGHRPDVQARPRRAAFVKALDAKQRRKALARVLAAWQEAAVLSRRMKHVARKALLLFSCKTAALVLEGWREAVELVSRMRKLNAKVAAVMCRCTAGLTFRRWHEVVVRNRLLMRKAGQFMFRWARPPAHWPWVVPLDMQPCRHVECITSEQMS